MWLNATRTQSAARLLCAAGKITGGTVWWRRQEKGADSSNSNAPCPAEISFYSAEAGFTLMELLLAFFIFAMIFVTIYTSYSGSFKTITMTENRMELYRKAAITLDRISEDLQSSYISVLPPNSFGMPAAYTRFLGEDNDINGSEADTLSFFSRIPSMFRETDETVSGQLISYEIIQGNEADELVLLRSENPEFIDATEEKEGLVLSDGLQSVNFLYYGYDGTEYQDWDSDSEEFPEMLPHMVTVMLEYLNPDNHEAPFTIMTSVAMPVSYISRQ